MLLGAVCGFFSVDGAERKIPGLGLVPKNGTNLRWTDFAPGVKVAMVRAGVRPNRAKLTASRHQHRTASVDYNIICAYLVGDFVSLATHSSSIVSGELVLITEDNDERTVRPGDIVLQRGTLHGWRNASPTTWVRMLSVLVDADPAVVNGVALRDDWRGENAMGG